MAKCNICRTELVYREPRPGQTWQAFWGCPNYKNHPQKETPRHNEGGAPKQDGFAILTEHVLSLETKVEELINLVKEQLAL